MKYEQELALLIEKVTYWTPERITHLFYSGTTPPNQKYGTDWQQVWEETELGFYIIQKKFHRSSIEAVLYGNDGLIYRLNNTYGEKDWDVWREIYLASFETQDFRIEVPINYQIIPVGADNWAFSVSCPPGGDLGLNVLEEYLEIEDTNLFFSELIEDVAVFASHMKKITEKYGVGTSWLVYCGGWRYKNSSGKYFLFSGNLNTPYEEAAKRGIAIMKVIHIGQFNILHSIFKKQDPLTDSEWNSIINNAKERWLP